MKNTPKNYAAFFPLDHSVKIYIPSTVAVNQAAANLQAVFTAEALGLLSRFFGGATSTAAVGAWVAASGELVKENVNICYAFCTSEAFDSHFLEIVDFCRRVCREMSQEAVSLEYDGRLAFITA